MQRRTGRQMRKGRCGDHGEPVAAGVLSKLSRRISTPMETCRFAAVGDDDGCSVWVVDYVHEVLLAAPWGRDLGGVAVVVVEVEMEAVVDILLS